MFWTILKCVRWFFLLNSVVGSEALRRRQRQLSLGPKSGAPVQDCQRCAFGRFLEECLQHSFTSFPSNLQYHWQKWQVKLIIWPILSHIASTPRNRRLIKLLVEVRSGRQNLHARSNQRSSLPDLGGDGNKRDKDETHIDTYYMYTLIQFHIVWFVCLAWYIYIYIWLHMYIYRLYENYTVMIW